MELVYKNERKLFAIALVFSVLFWAVLIFSTLGFALFYLLLGYLFFLFSHSGFISRLRGSGVRITREQYSDIYDRLEHCCEKVGVSEVPEAYLLRTDFFNALATRFRGRNFVVLFTDVVDALQDHPGALNFYLGHELGHIHRNHLRWNWVLFPALLLPVLGTAYRRAEEYTCDRYGVACSKTEEDVRVALAAIAAGDTRWSSINSKAYLAQVAETGGFWMSFHELTNDYPWLTKRMATALALKNSGTEVEFPRRSFFAWILSAFVPRFGPGGTVSVLVTIAIIGILAAIALPAYQDYTRRAANQLALDTARPATELVSEYVSSTGNWPTSLVDIGYAAETEVSAEGEFSYAIYDNGIIGIEVGENGEGDTEYIVLEPEVIEGEISWMCYGQDI